jgi:putative oxidoreductase
MERIGVLAALEAKAGRVSPAVALVPVRLVVGFGFVVHGLAKWNRGPEKLALLLERIGIPFPGVMARVTTATELLGGSALILGVGVALVCIPLIVSMLVALFSIHIHYGFSAVNTIGLTSAGPLFGPPGYEINLIYIAALVALAACEPTMLSVDRMILLSLRRRH